MGAEGGFKDVILLIIGYYKTMIYNMLDYFL